MDFADDRISLGDLQEWIAPRLHILIADPRSGDADAVATFEMGLVELESGMSDLTEFKKCLLELTRDIYIQCPESQVFTIGTSCNQNMAIERSIDYSPNNYSSEIISIQSFGI